MKKTIFNAGFPSYAIKNYDSFFLLKFFTEEQYRDYFLSGTLYMRQHTDFANQELGAGRFDITEGADVVAIQREADSFMNVRFIDENGEAFVQITESKERPENYQDNQMFISYPAERQRQNIFCMYTLWCNDAENLINTLDVEKMKNFGEYGVLITSPLKFINLVATAAEKDTSIQRVHCGFVNYISEKKNVMRFNPFSKPEDDFSYQNEFRICADTDNTELLQLSLGQELKNISIPIRLDTFAKTVHYHNRTLFFKSDTE